MGTKSNIKDYLEETKQICNLLDVEMLEHFIEIVQNLKGRLFILGVGGSAANASHAVNDFRKILNIEAYAPTDNVSELTAITNDENWSACFYNWLKTSKLSDKDAILVFSVGGGGETTSTNIVRALKLAKDRRSKVLSIVSRDGGQSAIFSDCCILIPVINEKNITPHAESFQSIVWHMIVKLLEK